MGLTDYTTGHLAAMLDGLELAAIRYYEERQLLTPEGNAFRALAVAYKEVSLAWMDSIEGESEEPDANYNVSDSLAESIRIRYRHRLESGE